MGLSDVVDIVKEKASSAYSNVKEKVSEKVHEYKQKRAVNKQQDDEYKKRLKEERYKAKLESAKDVAKAEREASVSRYKSSLKPQGRATKGDRKVRHVNVPKHSEQPVQRRSTIFDVPPPINLFEAPKAPKAMKASKQPNVGMMPSFLQPPKQGKTPSFMKSQKGKNIKAPWER